MGNIKQINIKNRTYYFFNDMTNIKDFDSSLIKNRQKVLQKILVSIVFVTSQQKKLIIMKILIV